MNPLRTLISLIVVLVYSSLFGSTNEFKPPIFVQNQNGQLVEGKIIDHETGLPIPLCNILVASSSFGTSSNELGDFIVAVDSLPIKLIFSHVNYTSKIIEFTEASTKTVSLNPLTTSLEEVIVSASKIDAFALKLAKNAIEKAQKPLSKDNYARAFYRQKSKNGDVHSEFSEIFYDIRYNNVGIKDWNINEGRYALKEESVHNRNFTTFSRILKPIQPNTTDLIFPLHPNFEAYYKPRIISMIKSGNSKIAIVHFKPIENLTTPTFDAEVYIDTNTFDILKIKGELARDDLKLAKLSSKDRSWKDYKIGYEIGYRKDDTAKVLLDFIMVNQAFDYYKDDIFQYHTSSTSNLIFYDHYTPTSRKRLGSRTTKNQSDWKNLDAIGYNEQFWVDNPIVKRTPDEEGVINSFEKENAFNSIFLNSAENIAFMSSNIAEDPFIKEFDSKTNLFNNYNPVEKVFLHTDKAIFSASETVWYSAYAVLGPFHQASIGSRVVHVDLINPNGEIVLAQTHELLNGNGAGAMELPENLPSGNYQLRSYTQWMRNFNADFFFTKELSILNEKNTEAYTTEQTEKIDLQFFPEGGNIIAAIAGKISFKAIGSNGLPRNIKGNIIDSKGVQVAAFKSFDRGAGYFQLMPKKGEQYSAQLDDGSQFPLPKVLENGYTIAVNNLNNKSIKVIIQASEALAKKPFYVIGTMRQRKYYQGKFEFGITNSFTFEIPKTHFPSGILTLSLFDSDYKPWCERPVFINNQEELVIAAKINSKTTEKRGEVILDIDITNTEGKPISTNLSLAITDKGQVLKDHNSQNILTQLLLQSEIKGHITDPGLLFEDQTRQTLQRLDLVMLTHGWRKFNWPEIWSAKNHEKKFDFSKGILISGKASYLNNKPLSNASLTLIAKSNEKMGMFSVRTALDGSFSVNDFNFNGATEIVFNAYDINDKPIDINVKLESHKTELPPAKRQDSHLTKTEFVENYNNYAVTRIRMNALYEEMNVTELDEVIITENKKEISRNQTPSVYGQNPDATLYTADNIAFQTVLQLVGLFNGVTVNGKTVSIRNRGTPTWVVDGIVIPNNNPTALSTAIANQSAATSPDNPRPQLNYSIAQATAPGPVPSYIANMNTFMVERIEILKGPSAAIYGSRGGNGVILIYTKRGEGQTYTPVQSPDFTISGHTAEKVFYSPKYDVKHAVHDAIDYRATLYWNPNIVTDQNGKAQIKFFNSDSANAIQISIEALSKNGIPGTFLKTYGN